MKLLLLALCLSSAAAFMSGPGNFGPVSSLRRAALSKMSGLRTAKLTLSERAPVDSLSKESDAAKLARAMMEQRPNKQVTNRKTVIVTGASSGIGLQAAAQLANKVNRNISTFQTGSYT
jgi:NADPH:quinone reductase-like Zn-dependent oxidoreductase